MRRSLFWFQRRLQPFIALPSVCKVAQRIPEPWQNIPTEPTFRIYRNHKMGPYTISCYILKNMVYMSLTPFKKSCLVLEVDVWGKSGILGHDQALSRLVSPSSAGLEGGFVLAPDLGRNHGCTDIDYAPGMRRHGHSHLFPRAFVLLQPGVGYPRHGRAARGSRCGPQEPC